MFNHINRSAALKVYYVIDHMLPPIIRDSRWLMKFPLWLVFGRHYRTYMNFKDNVTHMTEKEFRDIYVKVSDTAITRRTDLNQPSIDKILEHTSGSNVIDVGCGHGYMASLLSKKHNVTAVDIVISDSLKQQHPRINFQEASVESLPFEDQMFDTVICSHTLEHVCDIQGAIKELRRIGKKLIIVVPRQRPYKYTFDLHINFFPYLHSLRLTMGKTTKQVMCDDAGGDTFYMEY